MLFESPEGDRRLRLAYCLNLHAAEDLAGSLRGMREITLALRDRLAPKGRFGIGMYLPGNVALELASTRGERDLNELSEFLESNSLDPFTFNAFPFGGFHAAGLKRDVFAPTWCEDERVRYTNAVGEIAGRLNAARDGHLSISTHPGRFGAFEADEFERAAANFGRSLRRFADLSEKYGTTLRLAIEAEPRATAGDTHQVRDLLWRLHEHLLPELGDDLVRAHLGACLDACHSAVEFEQPAESVELATQFPLGKLQYSSAIRLPMPGPQESARAALFDLDEPRYLHQTTGRRGRELMRLDDLPEVRDSCAQANSPWLDCAEWRTHFHVPVDLEQLGESGLGTTRDHAVAILGELLAQPERWGSPELHVEIETYTWDILPGAARGAGDLIAGLEREYEHVLGQLESAGWRAGS